MRDISKISGEGPGWSSGFKDGGGGVIPVSKKFFRPFRPHLSLGDLRAPPGSPLVSGLK